MKNKSLIIFKSTAFNLYLCISTVTYASLCLLIFPFLKQHYRYKMIKNWCRGFVWAAKNICGIKYKINNLEVLQKAQQDNTKLLILSKHQSAWETASLIALLPQHLCYVFKKEILYIPFFGWVMYFLDMLYINRDKGLKAFKYLVKQSKDKFNLGMTPIIFPEGTRCPPYTSIEYKTGGVRIAMQNNVPIVAISHNAGQLWPKGSFIKYPGTINIIISPLITTENKTLVQINQEVISTIESNIIYC